MILLLYHCYVWTAEKLFEKESVGVEPCADPVSA